MTGRKRVRSPEPKRRRAVGPEDDEMDTTGAAEMSPQELPPQTAAEAKQRVFRSRQRNALDALEGRVAQLKTDNDNYAHQLAEERRVQAQLTDDLHRMRTFMSLALTAAWSQQAPATAASAPSVASAASAAAAGTVAATAAATAATANLGLVAPLQGQVTTTSSVAALSATPALQHHNALGSSTTDTQSATATTTLADLSAPDDLGSFSGNLTDSWGVSPLSDTFIDSSSPPLGDFESLTEFEYIEAPDEASLMTALRAGATVVPAASAFHG